MAKRKEKIGVPRGPNGAQWVTDLGAQQPSFFDRHRYALIGLAVIIMLPIVIALMYYGQIVAAIIVFTIMFIIIRIDIVLRWAGLLGSSRR